ncbi:aminoglycoside phosphotransferase family protein [Umezawaea sp. NPDC059074]|uniref:aminoglycoside phosphotransferase family protein n=1 Tax=Umezawaea sp. NPDC059074 TaxID=3346716 RepID=UPI0036CE464F
MLTVPPAFAEATVVREGDAGSTWIGELPALVEEFLERWSCTVSGPPAHGSVGVVLPVVRADGSDAVLKLSFPLAVNAAEPVVLTAWNGDGAARLLDRADDRYAMLLERLSPLGDEVPDPFTAVGRLARRLAVPAPPGLPSLAERALQWVDEVPAHAARLGNPLGRKVVDAAVANAREMAADDPAVLVHGDLHFGNLLRRDGDLTAVDPNGFVGDPAYDFLPLLRGEWYARPPDVERAIAEFADAAEVDRERVRRWAQARAAESALWSRDLGEPSWVTDVVDAIAGDLA